VRSSGLFAASLSALFLSACSGAGDRQSPTLELPFVAPEGAPTIVTDFIDVCSLSMSDQPAAIKLLSDRGWSSADLDSMAEVAAFGGYMAENEAGQTLQIIPVDFPHLQGRTCMLVGLAEIDEALPDFSSLDQIDGLMGGLQSAGLPNRRGSVGRYSGIAPSGHPITIQVITNDDTFFNANITLMRPVRPTATNSE